MSEAVQEILQRIQQLTEEDRLLLEQHLAERAEAEWKREAEEACPTFFRDAANGQRQKTET